MNKNIFTILIVALTTISFASCGDRIVVDIERYVPYIHDDVHNGIVINGVRWATRNVGAPGSFADSPESFGSHFQWNRQANNWISNWYGGSDIWGNQVQMWQAVNDPCPHGWRVPTRAELERLTEAAFRWTNVNGVYGWLFFGRTHEYLFLPAAGHRHSDGTISEIGSIGRYWSSSFEWEWGWWGPIGMTFELHLHWPHTNQHHPSYGFSIRCVR